MKYKRLHQVVALSLVCMGLLSIPPAVSAKAERAAAVDGKGPCLFCHDDLAAVLPSEHPAVAGTDLQSCRQCHTPQERGVAKPDGFAVRLHRTHLLAKVKADCLDCHSWEPGKSFGLPGSERSYGAPTAEDLALLKEIFMAEMTSTWLGARHAAKGFGCAACHGQDIAGTGGVVDNAACLGCHQPMADLISRTTPPDFPERNPHQSHLGEIGCAICHVAHGESKVYCLECHAKFEMTIK